MLVSRISALLLLSFAVGKSNAFSPHGPSSLRLGFQSVARTTEIQSSRDFNNGKQVANELPNDDELSRQTTLRSTSDDASSTPTILQHFLNGIKEYDESFKQRPPPEIEDTSVLLYDIFLLINLTASVSLWVVHRLDVSFIAPAISEGCLLSILWVASGLYSGAFLYSAVDGHRSDGGPRLASMLALNTFVNTMNLRLLFALGAAVVDHRPVGTGLGEDLIGLELGFGLVLMTTWRALHSKFTPRI